MSTSESVASSTEVSSLPKVSTGKSLGKKSVGSTLDGNSFGQVSGVERVGASGIRMGLSQSVTFREPEASVLGQEKRAVNGVNNWEEKGRRLEKEVEHMRAELLVSGLLVVGLLCR